MLTIAFVGKLHNNSGLKRLKTREIYPESR